MTNTEKRLREEFDEKTKCNKHKDCPITCDVGILNAYSRAFLTESIAQALAEERKRVVGEILELPRFIEEDDRGVKFPMVEIESIKNYAEQKGINPSLDITNKEI